MQGGTPLMQMTRIRPVLDGTLRLPQPQQPTRAIARNLQETLMDRDALRRSKSRGSLKCTSPLAAIQRFTTPPMGTNTPELLASGAHKMNARRALSKTRGQGAGI
jgi:hypothetical protein